MEESQERFKMSLDEIINTVFSFTCSEEKMCDALMELSSGEDFKVTELQRGVDRVLRLNIITKDKTKAEVLQILIDRLLLKNQQIECTDPKNGMKVKNRTREDFITFISNSIYENVGKEMRLIEEEIDAVL